MANTKQKKRVIVTVHDDQRGNMAVILKRMQREGLEGGEELGFGQVAGVIHPDKIAALERTRGVKGVRPELVYTSPPPDAPVQ